MLDRLASVHPVDRMTDAVIAVLESGQHHKYASHLEAVLLAHLGAGQVNTSPDGARAQALNDARHRRDRRVRGLACPACYDTGWSVDDDATAHRCECVGGPGVTPDPYAHPTPPQSWAPPEVVHPALDASRRALHAPDDGGGVG